MSKELEALERIKKAHYFVDFDLDAKVSEDYKEELDIIETAIKNEDKEKFELIKQVRELKDENASLKSFNSKLWIERQDNEKQLKALEIIKEIDKNALLQFISVCVKDQDKYDLLKEVLL